MVESCDFSHKLISTKVSTKPQMSASTGKGDPISAKESRIGGNAYTLSHLTGQNYMR